MPRPEHTGAKLGIIAGSGDLPRQLMASCQKSGREFFVVAIEGETDAATTEGVSHVWIRLGAVGVGIEHLREAGVEELVMAGKINRPSVAGIRPDALGAKLMGKLGLALFGGDASIFKAIIGFLEGEGFRVIGIEDLLQDLVAPEGPLGKIFPDKQAQKDIELGAQLIRAIGPFDVGQAVIVKNALVLGIEGAEGTDALIARCAPFSGEGKGGVLVKSRKPAQDDRADLPTIGVQTIERVHSAGFAGIAVEARHSLIVGRRETVRLADQLGLFLVGFTLGD